MRISDRAGYRVDTHTWHSGTSRGAGNGMDGILYHLYLDLGWVIVMGKDNLNSIRGPKYPFFFFISTVGRALSDHLTLLDHFARSDLDTRTVL